MRHAFALIAALLLALPASSQGQARTRVRLLLSDAVARPGETITAGIELTMPPRTHIYWRNPGEAGQATGIEWKLPAGVTADAIQWPVPVKLNTAGIINYGYQGSVILLVPLKLADHLPPGPLPLAATVSWLECEKLCVLGTNQVQATLTIGGESQPSPDAARLEAARKLLPADGSVLNASARWDSPPSGESRPLLLGWTPTNPITDADFYPYAGNGYDVAPTNTFIPGSAQPRLLLTINKDGTNWPSHIAGLIVEKPAEGGARAYEVGLGIGSALASGVPGASHSLALMLAFAFLGGLVLNIMPCVLPVIALKVLAFVSQSRESPRRMRALGLVYGLGVLASFAVLALIAIGVQQAGGLASWGMPLQNQVFRVVMTVVLTLVALNLFGVFEVTLSGRLMGAAGSAAGREGYGGAFFNGILATVLATPCTAPFLSAALAFAFTQSAAVTLLVFLAVGLGLATPFVALCWQPAWLTWLPKPGPWMEKFKIAMGFPILATAVWVFWFTASDYGDSGVLWLGLFLVVLAAAAWIWGTFVQGGLRRRGLAAVVALALVATGYVGILEDQLDWRAAPGAAVVAGGLPASSGGIAWQAWSPEAVTQARAANRPVLVDFTAKNCLTCQLNKRTSLDVPRTVAKLKEINAVALLGDFSNEDPRIAAELRRYDRPGVPLVLVYPRQPDSPPIVLPPLLTPGIVSEALDKAAD